MSNFHTNPQFAQRGDLSPLPAIEELPSHLPGEKAWLPFVASKEMENLSRGGFVALSAWLVRKLSQNGRTNSEFPLRGAICLRSNISLGFADREVHACDLAEGKGTLWLNVLTLGGINGVLPLRLTEDILGAARHGGVALHEFLDLLNRRFWELLFQSHRIGTRPQFGFQDPFAQRMVQELAGSYVGLRETNALESGTSSAMYKAYLVRYAFHAGRGSGGQAAIAELLSHTIGAPVVLSEKKACKIPVPARYQTRLGAVSDGPHLGHSATLGRKASIHQKLTITAWLEAAQLTNFYPTTAGSSLRALLSALNMALSGKIASIAMQYKVPCDLASVAGLGHATCRLAWGACLGGAALHTRFIDISSIAISSPQENP